MGPVITCLIFIYTFSQRYSRSQNEKVTKADGRNSKVGFERERNDNLILLLLKGYLKNVLSYFT